MRVSQEQLAKYRSQPHRYAGELTYKIFQHRRLATFPLQAGARQVDGSRRVEVLGTAKRAIDHCATMRRTYMDTPWTRGAARQLGSRFEDRDGHVLRAISMDGSSSEGFGFVPLVPMTIEPPLRVAYETLIVAPLGLTRMDSGEHAAAIACADVRWIVVDTTYAGTVTRRLDIPDFVMRPDGREGETPPGEAGVTASHR